MFYNSINNKGSRLLQALLLLFVVVTFAACKDDDVDQRAKDDAQIQQYFQANNIDVNTVTKTSSGLYYQKLEDGTGDQVYRGDRVSVHYTGTLLNGTKFDSSYDRNEPFEFQIGVGNVIRGWDEGLQLMREGEKARLFIPSHLGYGSSNSITIPANSPLVFEIEVLEIK
ncbi:FKBP-type peptidyl-prolyl cis-trans isomerase [Pontibacter oryzae]|uniref:Peptidyl-prolyl cis-trans isomerase n=1 Tax=Pontibacter oryzae TaxID=2304593 RepID=A0A399S243_9BACT|nr:FKBP-type peptidyl-prolyl cis-trans isomerase [Pontibacter oryzae]RIJ36673.1 FKBP-type peptidyl-prolyl cis-trans isomerase [Pontibacter oryzae]